MNEPLFEAHDSCALQRAAPAKARGVIEVLERIHREGFGVTVNLWAEADDFAVVLWRDGKPVGAGSSDDLETALMLARDAVDE